MSVLQTFLLCVQIFVQGGLQQCQVHSCFNVLLQRVMQLLELVGVVECE